jgi:hypothetical protein
VQRQRRLVSEGRAAPAVVTKITTRHTSEGGTLRTIAFDVFLPGGQVVSHQASATRSKLREGSLVCVLYDSERPGRFERYPLPFVRLVYPTAPR